MKNYHGMNIFCFNNYSNFSSVSSMLSLPTLQERRKRNKLIMTFNIVNNLIDISAGKFIPKQRSLRGGYYTQLCTKINSYKFSFFPSVIKLWNSLPLSVIDSPRLDDFCIKLDNYMHNTCAL